MCRGASTSDLRAREDQIMKEADCSRPAESQTANMEQQAEQRKDILAGKLRGMMLQDLYVRVCVCVC